MKKLTDADIAELTIMPTVDGYLVGSRGEPLSASDIFTVGRVEPAYANLLANAARMHTMITSVIKGMEANLEILEAEGLDRAAYSLSGLIASMKLVQKVSIDGPEALTAFKAPSK